MSALRWIVRAALGVVALAVGAALLAQWRWRIEIEDLDREVTGGMGNTVPLDPDSLPRIVARYLERAVAGSPTTLSTARLQQRGTFQMGEGEDGWRPFTAEEAFRASPPAFYWNARIAIAPGVQAYVRDSYVAGSARMLGKVAALVSVVDEPSSPELAEGALARYLAESVWFPARLAVGPGLAWSAVDDTTSLATLSDGEVTVSLAFTFDRLGDPVRVEGTRARATEAGFVQTTWVGTFAEHADVNGFRIPLYGEVGWMIDGEWVPYWRGRVQTVEYR